MPVADPVPSATGPGLPLPIVDVGAARVEGAESGLVGAAITAAHEAGRGRRAAVQAVVLLGQGVGAPAGATGPRAEAATAIHVVDGAVAVPAAPVPAAPVVLGAGAQAVPSVRLRAAAAKGPGLLERRPGPVRGAAQALPAAGGVGGDTKRTAATTPAAGPAGLRLGAARADGAPSPRDAAVGAPACRGAPVGAGGVRVVLPHAGGTVAETPPAPTVVAG